MRHLKAGRRLGRNAAHRNAMFRNLTMALIRHERIVTTVAKAKEVRPFIERLITLAKRGGLHARRLVLARLGPPSKAEVSPYDREHEDDHDPRHIIVKLFDEIAPRYANRPGGAFGAGPGFHGASAVHTHMTNTRITDPEILEHRYPVRLERFAIRRGSGGAGHWQGGDGAIRELTFLDAVSLSLLTQHRVERPYGSAGGAPGLPGRQRLVRASGEVLNLASVDGCEAGPGDRLILETPGGGGWGEE